MNTKINRRMFVICAALAPAAAAAAVENASPPPPSHSPNPRPAPKGGMPMGKIGGVEFSRLMLGGNLVAGYAHSRDLAYVAAHSLEVIVKCESIKLDCDFYQKTLHTHNCPTAPKPGETGYLGKYDNSWCQDPDQVVELMSMVVKPWIAFKVMAAGAISPKHAFPYAFNWTDPTEEDLRSERGGPRALPTRARRPPGDTWAGSSQVS